VAVTGHVFPQFIIGMNAGDIALGSGTAKIALSNATGPIGLGWYLQWSATTAAFATQTAIGC
jgi:hypothetical protein